MAERIVIAGATGFIGEVLCRRLQESGYQIVVLTRNPQKAQKSLPSITIRKWDPQTVGDWISDIDGAWAVINLAGDNIASRRWSTHKKNKIRTSRIHAAQTITQAIQKVNTKPKILLQASAIGFYGNRGDEELDENSARGQGFLAEICRNWEAATESVNGQLSRCIIMRLGLVLGAGGGMIPRIIPIFRSFLGGYPGNGKQWMSWIHIEDVVGSMICLLSSENIEGPVNLVAPEPVQARQFYQTIGHALCRPTLTPQPAFLLKLAMGKMAEDLMLTSQKVFPRKLLDSGYQFQYPGVKMALEDTIAGYLNQE